MRRRWVLVAWVSGVGVVGLLAWLGMRWRVFAALARAPVDGPWEWVERLTWIAAVAGLVLGALTVLWQRPGGGGRVIGAAGSVVDPRPAADPATGPAGGAVVAASNGGTRWRVGPLPPEADCLQSRRLGITADQAVVLSGMGGVGKTQLAAGLARRSWRAGAVDLLLWVSAGSRAAILSGYAEAAAAVTGAPAGDPQSGAARLLAWLADTDRRWLIVLDDLVSPGDMRGLWPPSNERGQTVVTTRRRDAVLSDGERRLVAVGPFAPAEAVDYLRRKLDGDGRLLVEADRLAADLGWLPLALAQAAGYLRDRGLDCAGYRRRLADRRRTLADLAPEDGALPDDHRATVEAAWSLSVELADRLNPVGLARPLLELASVLDPNGAPATVLTSPPALDYLARHRQRGHGEGCRSTSIGPAMGCAACTGST